MELYNLFAIYLKDNNITLKQKAYKYCDLVHCKLGINLRNYAKQLTSGSSEFQRKQPLQINQVFSESTINKIITCCKEFDSKDDSEPVKFSLPIVSILSAEEKDYVTKEVYNSNIITIPFNAEVEVQGTVTMEAIYVENNCNVIFNGDTLVVHQTSYLQPAIGSKTYTGCSYGRWQVNNFYGNVTFNLKRLVADSRVKNFSIGVYSKMLDRRQFNLSNVGELEITGGYDYYVWQDEVLYGTTKYTIPVGYLTKVEYDIKLAQLKQEEFDTLKGLQTPSYHCKDSNGLIRIAEISSKIAEVADLFSKYAHKTGCPQDSDKKLIDKIFSFDNTTDFLYVVMGISSFIDKLLAKVQKGERKISYEIPLYFFEEMQRKELELFAEHSFSYTLTFKVYRAYIDTCIGLDDIVIGFVDLKDSLGNFIQQLELTPSQMNYFSNVIIWDSVPTISECKRFMYSTPVFIKLSECEQIAKENYPLPLDCIYQSKMLEFKENCAKQDTPTSKQDISVNNLNVFK